MWSHSPLNDAELLTAAVFMGMLLGGMLAGSAADRLGRRWCLIFSLAVNCTFAAISSAAPSVGWLIAARVCAGLGESWQNGAKQIDRPFYTARALFLHIVHVSLSDAPNPSRLFP